jgi:hypothetical protein
MGFGTGPDAPGGCGGVGETSHRSSMSNFAATSNPIPGCLSPLNKTTSKIIDAFSNGNYVFQDVSMGLRILFPLRFLGLELPSSFVGFIAALEISGNMMIETSYGMWKE